MVHGVTVTEVVDEAPVQMPAKYFLQPMGQGGTQSIRIQERQWKDIA